jgi:hypothetical protein
MKVGGPTLPGRTVMNCRSELGALILAAALAGTAGSPEAQPIDPAKYPAFDGKWGRGDGPPRYDPSKPSRRGQQAPLTEEYQAIFEASLADQALGGQGNDTTNRCLPSGMPRQMSSGFPIEIAITTRAIYIMYESTFSSTRKIHTDGRDWPKEATPTFSGYSIGKWLDTDGDGRYDTLEVETRHIKGPRQYENSGIPLHDDNATVVKERMFLDRDNPDVLHDEMTTYDHALTRPWTVMKSFPRLKGDLGEDNCSENNSLVRIGKEVYYMSADDFLMPTKKGQQPPDLRYFKPK